MTPKVAMTWVNALRSGKFKQGYESLHNNEECTYCALGVLTKLYPGKVAGSQDEDLNGYYNIGLQSPMGYLPKLVTNVIELNDSLRLTFDEIADIIQIYYVETKELD